MSRPISIVMLLIAAISVGLIFQVGSALTQDRAQKADKDTSDVNESADKKEEGRKEARDRKDVEKKSAEKNADDEIKSAEKPQKTKGKEFSMTPEREAAALTFVQQHHPELTRLLEHLKNKSSVEYARAIRDLFQTSERLAKVRERDTQRYELELQLWKTKSRSDLLAARLQVKESPKLRDQLQQALADKEDAQIRLLELERDRLAERLKALEANIQARNAGKQESVEQRLKQVTKSALDRKKKREAVNAASEKENTPTKQIPTQKNAADQ